MRAHLYALFVALLLVLAAGLLLSLLGVARKCRFLTFLLLRCAKAWANLNLWQIVTPTNACFFSTCTSWSRMCGGFIREMTKMDKNLYLSANGRVGEFLESNYQANEMEGTGSLWNGKKKRRRQRKKIDSPFKRKKQRLYSAEWVRSVFRNLALVTDSATPIAYGVSDSRTTFTPVPTPWSRSSLSSTHRFMFFL